MLCSLSFTSTLATCDNTILNTDFIKHQLCPLHSAELDQNCNLNSEIPPPTLFQGLRDGLESCFMACNSKG